MPRVLAIESDAGEPVSFFVDMGWLGMRKGSESGQ